MATALEYSAEQLNYYRICYVFTKVLTEGLRIIFKQEWDNRYRRTWGEWKDQPYNGKINLTMDWTFGMANPLETEANTPVC